jgi:hypothetical protein
MTSVVNEPPFSLIRYRGQTFRKWMRFLEHAFSSRPTVVNHMDMLWEARLTLVTENAINDRSKWRKLRLE